MFLCFIFSRILLYFLQSDTCYYFPGSKAERLTLGGVIPNVSLNRVDMDAEIHWIGRDAHYFVHIFSLYTSQRNSSLVTYELIVSVDLLKERGVWLQLCEFIVS